MGVEDCENDYGAILQLRSNRSFHGQKSLDSEVPIYEACFFGFIVLLMLTLLALIACVMGTAGKDVTPEKKRSLRYSSATLFILVVGFVGFVPGSVVAMLTGSWYADAFKREKRPSVVEAEEQFGFRWALLLGLHVFFALGWNLLAPLQAVTGALTKPGDSWRKCHQQAGYVVAFLGICGILVGAALELHKRLDGPRGEGVLPFVSVMETGAMVIANTVAGIYYVKKKDIESHKAAMAWAAAWSTDAGGLRLCSYISSSLIGGISAFDDRVVSSATVMFSSLRLAIMLPTAASSGDIAWNFLLLNFVLLELRLVSAMSCWLSLFVGVQAAAVAFPLLSLGAFVGTRSLCSLPSTDEPDASAGPEQLELIKTPALLAWFRALVEKPQRSSMGLLLLLSTSLALSSPYITLKNTPLELEPMDTKLKDVQKILQDQYAWDPRSKMDIDVLLWGNQSLDEIARSVKDVVQGLALTEESCRTLKWDHDVPTTNTATLVHRLTLQVTSSAITTPNKCLAALRPALDALADWHRSHASMASANAVVDASLTRSDEEAAHHFLFSAPLMVSLLVLGVGSIPRALTPFLCLFASLLGARAVMVLIKWIWWDFNFSLPDTPLTFILMALCFDYSLFFWSRFSQERREHPGRDRYLEAILSSLRTSGFVILLSSGILIVTFLIGSVYPDHNKTGYLGTSFQLTVGVFFVGFYSLAVPAVLAAQMPSLFDEGSDSDWSIVSLQKWLGRPEWTKKISLFITSKPWVYIVPLAVCACFLPLLAVLAGADLSYDRYEAYASQAVPEFAAHRLLKDSSKLSSFTPALVLMEAVPLSDTVRSGDQPSEVTLSEGFGSSVCSLMESIIKETRDTPFQIDSVNVNSLWSQKSGKCILERSPMKEHLLLSSDGRTQLLTVSANMSMAGAEAKALTEVFWDKIEPQARNLEFQAGGQRFQFRASLDIPLAEDLLMDREYKELLPWIMLATVFAVSCIVSYCFSSAFVAGKMILTVVVPILAEYGLLVGIYQHGWLEHLGVKPLHGVWWMLPYSTGGVLFALAMDYDLFLFARVYERRLQGYDNNSAVRLALEETGPIITLAGTMMVVAFLFIFLNSLPMIAQLGCLYFFGVAIDTYIIRLWMAPAALCVYEPMNYWPAKPPPATKSYPDRNEPN